MRTASEGRHLQPMHLRLIELRDHVAAAVDGLALGTIYQPHARLGEIDLYRWILFVGEHEARHARQAAEIAEQLGATAR